MKKGRCNVGVDVSAPLLQVAGTGALSGIRNSRRGKWRAAVLIALHVIIAAHITQFVISGRTLSPVEPSESMYTLELGYVNAGFIFFGVALLSTLIFGRFVCGWGCHIVALQDLCSWIMKKLGVRPRPFRSRLLMWVPLLVASYMFVWPTFKRYVLSDSPIPFPGFTNHLTTTGFWDTFPGPLFAMLTFLTCGFAAVYFLGAKGFCTYGCPYGGLFGVVDQLSPFRIVVNDDCEQCGHCTATCTSNVRVHEEVRLYGRVVDPGCMKCTDCVSVCPKNALRLAFTRPSLFKGKPVVPRRDHVYTFGIGEELLLGGVFIVATLSFRGLYDGPPLLMSIALGVLTAFGVLKLWQLGRRPTVRIQNLVLKLGGKVQSRGWIFALLTVGWLAFTTHSAFAQWHRAWGQHYLEHTEATKVEVLGGVQRTYSEDHDRVAAESFDHFVKADRWGLVDVVDVKLGLAWGYLLQGDSQAAEREVRAAMAVAPDNASLRTELRDVLTSRARSLVQAERYSEAVEQFRAVVELGEDSGEVRFNLGGALRRLERYDEAIAELEIARDLAPDDYDTRVELGLAYMAVGENGRAITELEHAIELNPASPESQLHLPGLIRQLRGTD